MSLSVQPSTASASPLRLSQGGWPGAIPPRFCRAAVFPFRADAMHAVEPMRTTRAKRVGVAFHYFSA
jgi:hypothetical protein